MLKTWQEGSKCIFGRQHVWMTALSAALNSNEDAELPTEPEWVYWCHACRTIGPWPVEREIHRHWFVNGECEDCGANEITEGELAVLIASNTRPCGCTEASLVVNGGHRDCMEVAGR